MSPHDSRSDDHAEEATRVDAHDDIDRLCEDRKCGVLLSEEGEQRSLAAASITARHVQEEPMPSQSGLRISKTVRRPSDAT